MYLEITVISPKIFSLKKSIVDVRLGSKYASEIEEKRKNSKLSLIYCRGNPNRFSDSVFWKTTWSRAYFARPFMWTELSIHKTQPHMINMKVRNFSNPKGVYVTDKLKMFFKIVRYFIMVFGHCNQNLLRNILTLSLTKFET